MRMPTRPMWAMAPMLARTTSQIRWKSPRRKSAARYVWRITPADKVCGRSRASTTSTRGVWISGSLLTGAVQYASRTFADAVQQLLQPQTSNRSTGLDLACNDLDLDWTSLLMYNNTNITMRKRSKDGLNSSHFIALLLACRAGSAFFLVASRRRLLGGRRLGGLDFPYARSHAEDDDEIRHGEEGLSAPVKPVHVRQRRPVHVLGVNPGWNRHEDEDEERAEPDCRQPRDILRLPKEVKEGQVREQTKRE
mmetsp:Transcript_12709/g.32196  ORF Transcript_12709/g.32196 Transcript_12709/m.32196 type:complete len:251 (+) Transcript_12709:507-1259(+)